MTAAKSATTTRRPVQLAATVVAAAFLLIGILGFIPGPTTEYDGMTFAGHESTVMLLDIFHVSVLHNIVHLLFGIAGIALARTVSGASGILIGGGVVYLVLWLYGFLIDHDSAANFVPLNKRGQLATSLPGHRNDRHRCRAPPLQPAHDSLSTDDAHTTSGPGTKFVTGTLDTNVTVMPSSYAPDHFADLSQAIENSRAVAASGDYHVGGVLPVLVRRSVDDRCHPSAVPHVEGDGETL